MVEINWKSFAPVAAIMATGLIVSSLVIGLSFYKTRSGDNLMEVTGSARVKVSSDLVKWTGSFNRTVFETDLRTGYQQMAKDLLAVNSFLREEGINESDVIVSQIYLQETYAYDPSFQRPKEYNLRQSVELQSPDIEKITGIAKNTQQLINAGVVFSTDSLEYYYTKLGDARLNLLGDAVKDAQKRAEVLAGSGGRRIGSLKTASMGVVQVLPVNSTEVSDYGTYDTAHIEKEIMVTVRAIFHIK